MVEGSPRERIAALRVAVSEAESALASLEGRPAKDLWNDTRRVPFTPPEALAPGPALPLPEAVTLLVRIGRAKQELGDAAGAELAFRAAFARAREHGHADELPRLMGLECLALAECGRADSAASWLEALGSQVELLGAARADGLVWEAWTRLYLGRLDGAEESALAARAAAHDANPLTAARARLVAAWSALLRGQPNQALVHVAGLEGELPFDDERAPRSDAASVEAVALALGGELDQAIAALARAEAHAHTGSDGKAHDRVDAASAWVVLRQGQAPRARSLAQRAQRGLPPAATLERVLPALIECEACLAAARAASEIAGPQMAALLADGRRLIERVLRAASGMGLEAQARRVSAELEALYGLHLTAGALAELEALAGKESASPLEGERALAAVASVRARLGDPEANAKVAESIASGAQNRELELLLEVGRAISSMLELDPLLERIMDALIEFLNGERGFLMLYDEPQPRLAQAMADSPLRVRVARNMAREAVLEADSELSQSVVAEARKSGEPVIVNDAGADDRFADKASVMLLNLRSVLCLPLRTNAHDFGLVYLENRSLSEIFGPRHLDLVRPLTAQAALAIDNAFAYQANKKLYQETLSVARARERILNHVSHELKTPIAIVSGALKMLGKRVADDERLTRSLARAERNIQRLIDIQQHMLDIYEARHGETSDADRPARVALEPFLRDVIGAAVSQAKERELELVIDIAPEHHAFVVPEVLRSSVAGLFRNAIENTPDEGRVEVRVEPDAAGALAIVIHDRGVGISRDNLPHVFEGFFHTQATERYSSRRPFEFDAGGKGLDLLRIRAVAERYGWDLSLDSGRCRFIPTDADTCPGRISACAHCVSAATCHDSGWTEVRLVVPATAPIEEIPGS